MTEKLDKKAYQAAQASVLYCVDGMTEEFSWSKDLIARFLENLLRKQKAKRPKKRAYLLHQVSEIALIANASRGIRSKMSFPKKEVFF